MQRELNNKQIKLILISLSMTIAMMLISVLININYMYIFKSKTQMGGISYVFAIIAVMTCWLYYYIYNRDEFFIITLVYISFAVQHFIEIILIINLKVEVHSLGSFLFVSIYRMILFVLVIKTDNKLNLFLNKRKKISVITSVILTIILVLVESYIVVIIKHVEIITIFNILIVIYYIFNVIRLTIKIKNEHNFIWFIIVMSTNTFMLRKIYLIVDTYSSNNNIEGMCNLLAFIAFFILIIGLFIEIINSVKENEDLRGGLEVFYNLTEEDPINNVIMYNEKDEIVYANRLMRHNECIDKSYAKVNDIDNEYRDIPILNNNVDIELSNEINKKVNEQGYFNNLVFLKNGNIIKLDIRQVRFKKDELRKVVTFRYVTDEYNNNRKMRISENKFRSITENIKDIIGTIDIEGNITYVNNMVEEVIGYSKEELLGKKYTMLLDDSEEKTYNFIKSNYKDSAFMKHKLICKDKSIIIMESVISRIHTEDNELVGHVVVSRDISYREKFESLQLKYNEIRAYDKLRGEFFANISHELKTPINIIFSCFQLLNNKKGNGDGELAIYYNKYEKTIKQNCYRLLRLVNNLIDITKIDSGYIRMSFGNYNIVNLVEDITLSVVPYVEAKKINIMFDTEVEELEIKCDPDEIERIMLNLISNAIKFNNVSGSIFVNISVNETWVEISIKDTGIGVDEELRGCIFERFEQHDKSLNRENEGSGIGLALVKSLVELHDGQVYLRDNEGEGSEFIVKLPNVICENIDRDDKNISIDNTKSTSEKISIELSDIYDLL